MIVILSDFLAYYLYNISRFCRRKCVALCHFFPRTGFLSYRVSNS